MDTDNIDILFSAIRNSNGTTVSRFNAYVDRQEMETKEYLIKYHLYKAELRDNTEMCEAEKGERLEQAYDYYIEMSENLEILKEYQKKK